MPTLVHGLHCPRGQYNCKLNVFSDHCCDCEAGSYNTVPYLYECQPCEAGEYSSAGSSACTTCQNGKYSHSGSSKCEDCAAGSWSHTYHNDCVSCGNGYYLDGYNYYAQKICRPCEKGKYSNSRGAPCLSCAAGQASWDGASSCTTCAAGKKPHANKGTCVWCEEGTTSVTGSESCTSCSAGRYSGFDDRICRDCAVGKYSTARSTTCTECSAGSSAPAASSTCTLCAVGKFSLSGSSACVDCQLGTSNDRQGAGNCPTCAIGTYANTTGSTACRSCAAGEQVEDLNSTKGCEACPPGTTSADASTLCSSYAHCHNASAPFNAPAAAYCEDDPRPHPRAPACPPGQYASSIRANTSDYPGYAVCEWCPHGKHTTAWTEWLSNRTDASEVCTACDTVREKPTCAHPQTRIDQPYGFLCDAVCSQCTDGQYIADPNSTACSACFPGTYRDADVSVLACAQCAQDTIANASGSSTCTPCVFGTYTQTPGGSACPACNLLTGGGQDAQGLTPRPSALARLFTPDGTVHPRAPPAKISPDQHCLALLLDYEEGRNGRSQARVLVLGARSGTQSGALTLEGAGTFVDFAVTNAAVYAVFAGADVSVARIELDKYCRPSAVSQALHRNSSFVSLLRTCQHEHAVRPIQYTYVGPGYCMGLANEFYANPYRFYFLAHDVGPVQCKNACDVESLCIGYHHHRRNNECHKYYAHYHEANADPRFKLAFDQLEDESAYSITSHDNDGGACYRKNMDSRGIAFADTTDAYVLLCEAENTSTVAGAQALDTGLLQPWPTASAGVPRLVQFLARDGTNTSYAVQYAEAGEARLLTQNSTGAFVHLRALETQDDRDWVYAADAVRARTGAGGGELLFVPSTYPRVAELFANGSARAWQLRGCFEYEISLDTLFQQTHAHALLFARADCKATDELVDPAQGCVSAVGAYPNATEFYVDGDLGFLPVATCSTHQQIFPEALQELIFNNSWPQRKQCAQSIACEYGSLPAAGDATQCACRAGFAVNAETGGCEACVPGMFFDSTAAPNCTLCPAATPFSHRASTSARSCFAAYDIHTRDPGVLGELHALAHAVAPAGDTVAVHQEAAAPARASMSELRAQLHKQ